MQSSTNRILDELRSLFGHEFSILDARDGSVLHRNLAQPHLLNAWAIPAVQAAIQQSAATVIVDDRAVALLVLPLDRAGCAGAVALGTFLVGETSVYEDLAEFGQSLVPDRSGFDAWVHGQSPWTAEAIRRLGNAALEKIAAQCRAARLDRTLDKLSDKIGESYEQISLLFRIAENVRGACGPQELAQFVLDWMVNEIPAEQAVVQVRESQSSGAGHSTFLSIGASHVDRESLGALIEHIQPNLEGEPFVLNAELEQAAVWPFPAVRGLIVVPLRADRRNAGWLAAVNHAQEGWFGSHHARLLNASATIIGLRLMMQEMADLRQAAEASSAAKSRFLANVSHELRTPLNGIMSFTRLLLDGTCQTPEDHQDALETVHACGERLLEKVTDVLEFSNFEAGIACVQKIPCRLEEIMVGVVSEMRTLAVAKGLFLKAHTTNDARRIVHSDPSQLKRVLTLLVRNAIKFTGHGGVFVESSLVHGDPPRVKISVRDTGIGIPRAKLEGIFDPFEQTDGSSTRHYDGLGLGLAICRQIAHSLDGDLTVNSRWGEGSTFTLDLPACLACQDEPELDAALCIETCGELDRQPSPMGV